MLPRSSQTRYASGILSPENVHPLQNYVSDLQTNHFSFPSLGNDEQEKEGQESSPSQKESLRAEEKSSDITNIISGDDFQEMLSCFFVTSHNKLRLLQSQLQNEINIDNNTLFDITDLNNHKIQEMRRHYYQLQMVLFQSPKGQQHDTLL
ncbi:hypothetical protein [Fodinibius salsisoli]|uniref:DUF294 domain-containing protein n=1 Tax=Fodinibius salsisoli TaxID=2820877 RepID=A0ABT3PHJ6_9BACT|nr:hypothetical protein [Fodinibius salsisoli]MCW9705397.1 hypothetical protein [Fodinibius salsisoli]